MSHDISCYRCGASLAALTLPLSRRDLCPDCGAGLHVCRMCSHYDRSVAEQCREEDAETVSDKEGINFCEWFEPSANAFDPGTRSESEDAERRLEALFGDGESPDQADDDPASEAEKLFQ